MKYYNIYLSYCFYVISLFIAIAIIYPFKNWGLTVDDIFILQQSYIDESSKVWHNNYIQILARGLNNSYLINYLYQILGNSATISHRIFIILWILNGILFYSLIKKFYTSYTAGLAGIFFLFYSSKSEAVTVLNYGLENIVVLIFLLILNVITHKNISWNSKTILISMCFLIGLLLNRAIILLSPILIIYYEIYIKNNDGKYSSKNYFLAYIPIFISGIFIIIWGSNANLFWDIAGPQTPFELLNSIQKKIWIHLSYLLGPIHWNNIGLQGKLIEFILYQKGYKLFTLLLVILFLIIISIFFFRIFNDKLVSKFSEDTINSNFRDRNFLLFIAAYIMIFGGFLQDNLNLNQGLASSFSTYLPSVGLSILMATLLTYKGVFGKFFIFTIGIWTATEAIALKTIYFQYQYSIAIDDEIYKLIKPQITMPEANSGIVLKLPTNKIPQDILQIKPGFYSNNISFSYVENNPFLVRDVIFNKIPNLKKINYEAIITEENSYPENFFAEIINNEKIKSGVNAYVITNERTICQVEEIVVKDVTNKKLIVFQLIPRSKFTENSCIAKESVINTKLDSFKLKPQNQNSLKEGVDFTKPGFPLFINKIIGLSYYENDGRWTDASESTSAIFYFKETLPFHFSLDIGMKGFGPNNSIEIKAGDQVKKIHLSSGDYKNYHIEFSNVINANYIEIIPNRPISPKELGLSNDSRKLGIKLISLKLVN